MALPISIKVPRQLGLEEARRRIEGGFANIVHQLPGIQRWDGDWLTLSVRGLGQTVSGVVDVLEAAVKFEIELPGVLGMIASSL